MRRGCTYVRALKPQSEDRNASRDGYINRERYSNGVVRRYETRCGEKCVSYARRAIRWGEIVQTSQKELHTVACDLPSLGHVMPCGRVEQEHDVRDESWVVLGIRVSGIHHYSKASVNGWFESQAIVIHLLE